MANGNDNTPVQHPFPGRIRSVILSLLMIVELGAFVMISFWAFLGAWRYATTNDWSLPKLLELLTTNWKGALILGSLVFYRTVHEVLARIKVFRVPFFGELGSEVAPREETVKVTSLNKADPKS